jgi:hypothetical protein
MISCAVCARRLVVYGIVLSRWRQEFGSLGGISCWSI